LNDFSKFRLYKVITQYESTHTYKYLTFFEDGWIPLNDYSILTRLDTTVVLRASEYNTKVIADDNQTSFWRPAKANPKDEMILLNDVETKVSGSDSLKMYINGTANMVIGHSYESPQDWSSSRVLTFYLYGANTSKSITITFHTKSWQDYYAKNVKDDFVGWRRISIPLDSFGIYGKPSWSSIIYIEILLGNRTSTYFMDQIRLEGYAIGLEGPLPSITSNSPEANIVLSIGDRSLQSPAIITLTSHYGEGTLTRTLDDGVNLITVPSSFLQKGADLTIYYYQSNIEEELELYYLGILSKP